MNKKLLTVAIGAALAAPTFMAQADVKVYGRLQAELANVEVGSSTSSNTATHLGVSRGSDRMILNDTSMGRVGVAVDEDLGGGLKGIGVAEFGVDTADGAGGTAGESSAPLFQREIWVGLDHKAAGKLRLGRFNSPYQLTGIALDPFVATTLEARGNMGMTGNADGLGVLNGHSAFLGNGINYTSPTLAGISANVYVGVDGTGAAPTCGVANMVAAANCANSASNNATGGDVSATLGWAGGPANVSVGYNKIANVTKTATADNQATAMKVTGSFKFGTSTISAQYEIIDRASGQLSTVGGDEASVLFLGYQLALGSTTIAAQLGQAKNDQANLNEKEGTYYAVGAIYNFSKTMRAFGGYRSTSVEDSNTTNNVFRDESVLSVGLRKDF